MTRRSANLRSPAANLFYPEHAPNKEAIYMTATTKSMPSFPSLSEAWERQSHHLTIANEQRLVRSAALVTQASQESAQLMNFRTSQRVSIEKARKQERLDHKERMRVTTEEREKRWVQKLADHPFSRDLWKEDVKIYDRNRVKDDSEKTRRKDASQREIEERGSLVKKKCGEVDELGLLRKERKNLLENHKIMKTRLDIERKSQRLGVAPPAQPASPSKASPEAILRDSSFVISPARHGAVTCKPKSEGNNGSQTEGVRPLEESAGEYYTKWSGEKPAGDKDCVGALETMLIQKEEKAILREN